DMNLFQTWLGSDFSAEGHSRMVERLLQFNSGERKISVETAATRFNGERFPILQTIEIVGDDESDWSRVYTTIQDLTERHKAEVELRDSEQKFRNLAEGSLQGIAVFDLNWDIKFVNQALAKMLGFAKTEALFAQQNWANFIVDYEIPRMLDYQQKRLLGDNPPSQYELDLVKANGDVFTCLMGVRLIEWNNSSAFQCLIFDISDHKQAELALTESEARFRAFMNNTPDPIIISDIQGRYLFANRQFENLYRVSSDQLMGQLPSDLVDEDDSKLIMVEEQRVRETREVRNYHQTSYLNDEEMLWSVTRFPILDESGNLTATGEISRDITQQRRIELALQQSEQSYRRLFDHAPIALYQQNWSKCKSLLNNLRQLGVVDLRKHLHENPDLFRYSKDIGQIINVNREAVSMHRSTDKKMQIEWQSNHLPEQVRDSLIERLLLLEAGNRRASSEGIGIRIDGEEFPKLSTTVILGDDLEDWSLIYTAEIDLTELKEAERALQESEHRYRQLFETAPVALWEQDWSRLKSLLDDLRAKGVTDIPEHLEAHPEILEDREKFIRIIDVNSETLRLYGASDTNQLRRSIFAPSWQQQNLGLLERIDSFLKGNIRVVIESEGVRINGSRFPVRVTTEIVGGDSEDWSEVYSTHQDITEEVLAAERLGAYRDELRSLAGKMSLAEESERRKISSALHDGTIQNLVLARMQVSALSKSLNTRKSQDSLESINQLLESSIKETRTMIFEISPPVLYELGLKAAIEWLTDQFKRRTGIDVLLVVDDKNAKLSEELKIVIFQAMREFLVNITKHAEADKITIRWTSLRDHLEIEIEDNGVGFDITDVGNRSSEEGGFGLFSLRERLSLLGAEFSITSSCKGTRVTLVAPLLTSDDYTALN
ncbi:MAG: PAS domain S-box-containing protein, partial [Planctomycetota bacterium]